jgi:vacuolar iron transporter family protein
MDTDTHPPETAMTQPASAAPSQPTAPSGKPSPEDVDRYRENLQGEIDAIALYRRLGELEEAPALQHFYSRMADVEEVHASVWRQRLADAGVDTSGMRVGWRNRILMMVARYLGPGIVVPTIAEREAADEAMYDDQSEALARMPGDERSHARLFRELAGGHGVEGGAIARIEGRHRAGGGNQLRAAVLGANDGLISNLSIAMGVAGASSGGHAVLIAGMAGMLAGALSMAIGEWLSVQSARELFAHQVKVEREELLAVPDEEEEELALIYEAKGLPADQARQMAKALVGGETERAVDTLAREELGIDPGELGGSAWVAAITSFCLFGLGALIPILPFVVGA